MTFLRIVIPLYLFFEHDLFGKPVPTFPDHARGNALPPRQTQNLPINRKSTACPSTTLPFRPSCKFSAKGCARLTQSEVPSTPDTEKTFEELKQRLSKTIDYVKSFKPAQFEGADSRDVSFPAGPNNTMTLKGQQFLSGFAFPNFYFHAATTHGILRHNGVEIGKRDFLGVK